MLNNDELSVPPDEMAGRARRGFGSLAIGRFTSQAIQFGTSVVLARLLVPEDFGLLAMAIAVGAVARAFGDFGVSAFVIQRRQLDTKFASAAFTLNFLISVAMAVIQIAVAPVGALAMGEPRLVMVMMVLALNLPISALGSIHRAFMKRNLEFRRLMALGVVNSLVNAVFACPLAFLGLGVWSIVGAHLAASISTTVLARWLAREVDVHFSLDDARGHFSEIVRFGKYATGNSLIEYIVYNADYLLIGRLLSTELLGFYFFAYEKSRLASVRLLRLVSDISFPAFSRIHEDNLRLQKAYKLVTVSGFALIAPVVIFLAIHAEIIIPLIFGTQWKSAVVVFQILSLPVLVNAATSGVGSVIYAIGRPEISFRIMRWVVAPLIVSYYVGAKLGGIVGVAVAVALVKSAASILKLRVTLATLDWEFWPIMRPIAMTVMSSCLAGAVSVAARISAEVYMPQWASLILCGCIFAFLLVLSQSAFNREALRLLWDGMLGPQSLTWCQRRLPPPIRRVLAFPAVG